MQSTWRRIETWLATYATQILNDLLAGATKEQIRDTEKTLGVKFPSTVKTSYGIHDGQQGMAAPLMGEWQLLSLEDVVSQRNIMQGLLEAGKFANITGTPVGPVKADWWNPKWIPLAYNGAGDFYCLDLDPAPKGKLGQIITFWHMDEKRERIAESFQALLQNFADDLEKGKYIFKDGQLLHSKEE